jgi:predicted nucleic-acid-binding protein
MRAVDTNVLVRLIAQDDPAQAAAAASFVAPGAWVPLLALAEAAWVLDSVYSLPPRRIAAAIEVLLNHESLSLQDADAVAAALAHFRRRPALKFSDCLILETARKAGHQPLGTFDRALGRIEGAQRL